MSTNAKIMFAVAVVLVVIGGISFPLAWMVYEHMSDTLRRWVFTLTAGGVVFMVFLRSFIALAEGIVEALDDKVRR